MATPARRGQWRLRLTPHAAPQDDDAPSFGAPEPGGAACKVDSMSPNKKKVMLPETMAKAGWDVLIGRDDIEAVGYDPYISMADLQAAL